MTDQKHTKKLLPCPFCGSIPALPNGRGSQYELECSDCGCAIASVQICDLMTIEERMSCDDLIEANNWSYPEQYVERAKMEAIEMWNTRYESPLDLRRERDELREALEYCLPIVKAFKIPAVQKMVEDILTKTKGAV